MTQAVRQTRFRPGISAVAAPQRLPFPNPRAFDDGYAKGLEEGRAELARERGAHEAALAELTATLLRDEITQRQATLASIANVLTEACTTLLPAIARAAIAPWVLQTLTAELEECSQSAIRIWCNPQIAESIADITADLQHAQLIEDSALPLLRVDWQTESDAKTIDLSHVLTKISAQLSALSTFDFKDSQEAQNA